MLPFYEFPAEIIECTTVRVVYFLLSCLSPCAEDESALFTAQNPIHFQHSDKAHHPRVLPDRSGRSAPRRAHTVPHERNDGLFILI